MQILLFQAVRNFVAQIFVKMRTFSVVKSVKILVSNLFNFFLQKIKDNLIFFLFYVNRVV